MNEIANNIINEYNSLFSVSKINTFNDCSMKYKFRYIDSLKSETSLSLIKGSVVHNLLQKKLKLFFDEGLNLEKVTSLEVIKEFILELINDFIRPLKKDGDYNTYNFKDSFDFVKENKKIKEYKKFRSIFFEEIKENEIDVDRFFSQISKSILPAFEKITELVIENGYENIFCESKMTAQMGENGLRGYIDISSYDSINNRALIFELKTSKQTLNKIKESNINQILFYKNLYRERFKDIEIKYYIMYISILKTKISINTFDVSNLENNNYQQELQKNLNLINHVQEKSLYIRNYGQHCTYCGYTDKCFW